LFLLVIIVMGQLWGRAVARNNFPLEAAIRREDVRSITSHLEAGYDAGAEEPPLCLASRIGNEKSVETLMRQEIVDPDQEDRSGFTPLILAVYAGHINIVKMLLQNNYVNVNKVSKSGATAFDVAIITGKYDIAQLIMDNPEFNVRIRVPDVIDEDLLLVQSRRLNREAIKIMIRAGYNIDITDEDGHNCLWYVTLPPRRRGALAIIVQRVRGSDEEKIREELVEMLTDCGVSIHTRTMENIAVTVPKMQTLAKQMMTNPLTLKQICRRNIWKTMNSSKYPNVTLGISSLRHTSLPAVLTDYLLYEKYR